MTWAQKKKALVQGLPPLVTFIIIIFGTLMGIFTPTEASIIAALYNFILAKFVYRTLRWKDLAPMLISTAFMTAGVMMLIGVSSIFSWLLAYTKIPDMLVGLIFSLTSSKYAVLLLMMLVFLLIGMVMDDAPACIIFVPMFLPIAMQLGMNPIQFGIWCVMCLAIGQYTPPVGAVLFLSCKIGKCSIEKATKALIPFFVANVVCCLLVLFFEPLTTVMPSIAKLFTK